MLLALAILMMKLGKSFNICQEHFEETYDRCLKRAQLKLTEWKYCQRLLLWIASSLRLLSASELKEAISVDDMGDNFDRTKIV